MLEFLLGLTILILILISIHNYISFLILVYYLAEKGIELSEEDLQRCQKAVANHFLNFF